jgi:hypothetical protein
VLGIPSRYELDGFLKQHEVYDYTIEDFDHDLATIRELNEKRRAERPASSSLPILPRSTI